MVIHPPILVIEFFRRQLHAELNGDDPARHRQPILAWTLDDANAGDHFQVAVKTHQTYATRQTQPGSGVPLQCQLPRLLKMNEAEGVQVPMDPLHGRPQRAPLQGNVQVDEGGQLNSHYPRPPRKRAGNLRVG